LQKVLLREVTCVIRTAGPYYSDERSPTVLDAVIATKIPVYVDVSDPIPFLEASLAKNEELSKVNQIIYFSDRIQSIFFGCQEDVVKILENRYRSKRLGLQKGIFVSKIELFTRCEERSTIQGR
jgi:hypothetical protein